MKKPTVYLNFAAMGIALTAACTLSAIAAEPVASKPDADQILREACAKLAGARQFSFKAHREIDAALIPGSEVAEDSHVAVTVARPNKAVAKSEGTRGGRHAYFDGRTFTLFDAKMNLYSTVPMRTTLDGLVDKIDRKYGFTPPLAEFTLSDPYKEFRRQARTLTYLGQAEMHQGFLNLGSVDCYRLKLSGHSVNAELWVGVNDHLIKRLVATFNDKPGKPRIKIEFFDWNLAANVTANEFNFVPPKGAMKIHMRGTGEMGSAPVKAADKKN